MRIGSKAALNYVIVSVFNAPGVRGPFIYFKENLASLALFVIIPSLIFTSSPGHILLAQQQIFKKPQSSTQNVRADRQL